MFGNIASCFQCADALKKLGEGADANAGRLDDSKSKSESEWEKGAAGDAFRERISDIRKQAERVSDESEKAGKALNTFSEELLTIKQRMEDAARVAIDAKLHVTFNGGNAEWIFDPAPQPMGPLTADARNAFAAQHAKQVAAYSEALTIAGDARNKEMAAMNKLRQELAEGTSALYDLKQHVMSDAPWLAPAIASGVVEGGVKRFDKWAPEAATRAAQVQRLAAITLEGGVDTQYQQAAAKAMEKFLPGAAQAGDIAAFNRGLAGGNPTGMMGKIATQPMIPKSALSKLPSGAAKIAGEFPAIGAAITVAQTGFELQEAEDWGDVGRISAKNGGGFVAGTLATAGLATLGAPVVVTVGVGVVVGLGIGFAIDQVLK